MRDGLQAGFCARQRWPGRSRGDQNEPHGRTHPVSVDPTGRRRIGHGACHTIARAILDAHGTDSLSPFLLRPDKALSFAAGGVLAYRVIGATAVISADPVAPDGAAADVLCVFQDQARRRGWQVVLWGAAETHLEAYRVGDTPNGLNEALVAHALAEARRRGVPEVSLNYAGLAHLIRREPSRNPAARALTRLALGPLRRRFLMDRLVRFNEKFAPQWRPRYLVYESRATLPLTVARVLQAEGYLPRRERGRWTEAAPGGRLHRLHAARL
ncbi:MAG TPA: phosphatidylglycerol lysyltransferase domain-containing protein [Solirubrobacteraceae bacterium]|nr:phosphatidylglycerol lysyltransferase domain-containing protein [Solirubrobacteraceae bacterium]